MVAVSRQIHRQRRGDTYYFRVAIPQGLQACLGGKEFKRSLRTSDWKVASRICRVLSNKAEDFFQAIIFMRPTANDLKQLMRDYFEEQICSAKAAYADARGERYGKEPQILTSDPFGFIEASSRQLERLKSIAATYHYSPEQETAAKGLLSDKGFDTFPHGRELAHYLMEADIEVKRIESAFRPFALV